MKINSLQIENVKRVKAVRIEPTKDGLTIIGGNNNQGKTSILDSIAWALGGNKFKPTSAQREGAVMPPKIKIELNNGLIVERTGKNSDLKVIDPSGNKAGQALLDTFVEELALNLPKFMSSSNKEKANTLLQIIGVGEQLYALEQEEANIYNRRHAIGQIADQKKKYADEMLEYPNAPTELVSASELIQKLQEILAQNGENQRKRDNLEKLQNAYASKSKELDDLRQKLQNLEDELLDLANDITTAKKTVQELKDESTAEIEASIKDIESINIRVRANADKMKAEEEASQYKAQYDELTEEINRVREEKYSLLENAHLPLEGLSVEDGELVYQGHKWDSMSGSDQLKVATAIVRAVKPECQFVLLDKLEQMDMEQLNHFGEWAAQEGLQIIATRVSTGEECTLIVEDGYVKGQEMPINQEQTQRKWEAGKF